MSTTLQDLAQDLDQNNQRHDSLRAALSSALPEGFRCRVRYAYSSTKRCGPLFSPVPGQGPERTRLASHFLTVSITASTVDGTSREADQDAFVYAIEVLVYSTARLATMFVSKADSTGYLRSSRPSPIRTISSAFLSWLAARERQSSPGRKLVISLFARAQSQYLFPGSAENANKHVLDDRQLIKWWVRVLDPLVADRLKPKASDDSDVVQYRGYLTVPGYQTSELRHFLPLSTSHWRAGNPLPELCQTRGVPEHAPTRCLLPRFPDDPKARFMQDLDDEVGLVEDAGALATTSPSKRKHGRWRSIQDLDRFWEAMEFRQECSSGRVVGFLWVVIGSNGSGGEQHCSQLTAGPRAIDRESSGKSLSSMFDEQDPQESQRSAKSTSRKLRRRQLTGPIEPRQPRLKGGSSSCSATSEPSNLFQGDGVLLTKDGYDQAMQTLLHLDFANVQVAAKSTAKWVAEVSSICGLPSKQWTLDVVGTAVVEKVADESMTNGHAKVNDLGGMIKKKRKQEGDSSMESKGCVSSQQQPEPSNLVNMLGSGLVRKKPKTNGAA